MRTGATKNGTTQVGIATTLDKVDEGESTPALPESHPESQPDNNPDALNDPSPSDKDESAWLKRQAARLKSLEIAGDKLKLDFVQNARAKGKILTAVHDRVSAIKGRFRGWLTEETDIGYSTALLWMDVATHYEEIMKKFADSNVLELTMRQFRDAIRDARQEQGRGKPGSGKRKDATVIEPGDADEDTLLETAEDDAVETDKADSDNAKWDREVVKAEAEAAEIESGGSNEVQYPVYKMMVIVKTEADQMAIYRALSKWSPISKTSLGAKQVRSVTAHSRPEDIATLLDTLGKSLAEQQPKAVRVSIEL